MKRKEVKKSPPKKIPKLMMNDPENSLPPMDRWRIGDAVLQEPKRINGETGNRRILALDVTIEILSSLPAKSLVRFRRVCKLWHSITHHPHFIESHLRKTRARPPTLLLFPYYAYRFIDPNISITRLDCCDDPSARLNPKHVIRDVILYASCNGLLGLLCLSNSSGTTTLVVNPATGDSLTLPPSSPSPPWKSKRFTMPYFGFEPATKEYKVVRIFTDHKDVPVWKVFTLGTDTSWRRIHASLHFRTFGRKGITLNGAIYWQASLRPCPWQDRDRDDEAALCFDLKYECFHRITLPCFENFYSGRNYAVSEDFVELQGSLCLPVFTDIIRPGMDIWVTTSSSNVKQEWSLKYSVMFSWVFCLQPTPLLIRNGKILVHHHQRGSRLRYHDLHPNSNGGNNSYKEVCHMDKEMIYRVPFIHVESLVPLPS